MSDFSKYAELPKWPGLLVTGKSVTIEQAGEILVRTTYPSLSCNDREWRRTVESILGLPAEDDYSRELSREIRIARGRQRAEVWESLGLIDLSYLTNSRISSSYIGGPYGWCNWNGSIRATSYNIGKWPSLEEVYNDWVLIAEAFPFLDLTSQLLNQEVSEDTDPFMPVIEYRVKDGKVTHDAPRSILAMPENTAVNNFILNYSSLGRERGVSPEHLRKMVTLVRAKIAAAPPVEEPEPEYAG